MVDGLAVTASLQTSKDATGNNALGLMLTYTGVEGLSVSYGSRYRNWCCSTSW